MHSYARVANGKRVSGVPQINAAQCQAIQGEVKVEIIRKQQHLRALNVDRGDAGSKYLIEKASQRQKKTKLRDENYKEPKENIYTHIIHTNTQYME